MKNKNRKPPQGDSGEWPLDVQERIHKKCVKDIIYWINNFCYSYDPREKNPTVRFQLYPFQEELVKLLVKQINSGEDLLIDKSRDMGVSWVTLLVFQWFWLFEPGSAFLLGSRKMDFVDRRGDISTLMEKLRYNLNQLPKWMLPEGFDPRRHANLGKLINPQNGNSIMGEANTANFARGGRYKAILMDEFAFWERTDDMAYASASQSTRCRIVVSTPHGKANKFADLRFNSPIRTTSVHWSVHPKKTQEWYEKETRRMSEDEIARELDINYHLSSRDRVFREFTIRHKKDLQWNRFMPVIRSWDFGYHVPAVLFLQMDPFGRLNILHEEVGDRIQIKDFAEHVLRVGDRLYPGAVYEDFADPAGGQRNDKSDLTSLEILGQMGIYPAVKSHTIFDEIEILRGAMTEMIHDLPGLVVHEGCHYTIAALEGGYRYNPKTHTIIQEHPYEDVMDCLRYAASHKLDLLKKRGRPKAPRRFRPGDPYTGY